MMTGNLGRKPETAKRWAAVWRILYAAAVAFVFITLCSRSSFLYPMNDWVDPHCFFTVGKGMANGLVPYRDLFEQKGPLLYFLHMLAYLVSHTTFLGVYLLELAAAAVCLWFAGKITGLFLPASWSYITVPLFAFFCYTSTTFCQGDSAEELCMPLLAASLYFLLKHLRDPAADAPGWGMVFANGAIAGCILWIKYSMLGFWLGWMAVLFFSMLVRRRIARAFAACGVFLGGMAAATLPWLLYFGCNRALGELYTAYFYANTQGYGGAAGGVLGILGNLWKSFIAKLDQNPFLMTLVLIGVIGFLLGRPFASLRCRVALPVCAVLGFCGIFFNAAEYGYYFLICGVFAVFGLIVLCRGVRLLWGDRLLGPVGLGLAVLTALAVPKFSGNIGFMRVPQQDLAQFRFAQIMHERSEHPTLLNYDFLDGGFYTVADILPNCKYFTNLNLDPARFPDVVNGQKQAVAEQQPEFLVLRPSIHYGQTVEDVMTDEMRAHYTIIAEHTQAFEGWNPTYYLLERNAGLPE